jgi:hypothetical protein
MNSLGYFLTLLFTIIVHILLKKFNDMQQEQKALIENYKNKLGLNPTGIKKDELRKEYEQKYIDFKDYDYKNVDFSSIEEDGYDIDNDYDAFKEDLMKYVEGANDYFKHEKKLEPVATEASNIYMNENAVSQPMNKKEYVPTNSKVGDISMDRQMKNAFEANNKQRQQITGVKTLKNDQWTYSNEKTMNGGFVDEKSGLMPFDNMESDYMALL